MKWRPIWNEAVELSTRARKTSSIASEMLTVNLTRELITFLHTARHYITKDDANEMLVECMASLTDMRSVKSAEAMICLVILNNHFYIALCSTNFYRITYLIYFPPLSPLDFLPSNKKYRLRQNDAPMGEDMVIS